MPIRNGIRSALRARGRAALFALLILTLTLALTLGMGLWVYCAQLLARFDETYTSIVLAEYIGEDYPDADAADEETRRALSALDDRAIAGVEGVTLWERTDSSLAALAGYIRPSGQAPYKDYGVLVASNLSPLDSGYTGRISQVVYTEEGKDSILAIFDPGDTDFAPERGKKYLLHGRFMSINSTRTFVVTDFYEGCDTPPFLELTGDDDPALFDSLFTDQAEHYRTANNTAAVTASDNIAALEPFQQGMLYLAAGRFPLAGEAGVCLLDGSTAERLGAAVGDSINISILVSDGADRYDLTTIDDSRLWQVVGVTNVQADYEGCLWVSKAEGGFSEPLFGYELGRAVLDNRQAIRAMEALEALMPDQVRLTLYDQGYSAAAQPVQAMRSTAMAVTSAAVCGAMAVLFLFAYLFVGRQRETVQVLVSLGTPKGKIRLWLLSGAGLIAVVSAALGALAGHLSLGRVIAMATAAAEALYTADLRYSNAALGVIRQAPAADSVPPWCATLAGVAVLVTALILCLVFLRQARRENAPKRGRTSVRVPKGGTSLSGRGAARFALLSARRGGWRSAVVPAATLVLTMLLGALAVGAEGWETQLNDLYENSALEGQMVSTNGRSATKLVISAPSARQLWKSGLLSDISVSLGWNYWMEGQMPEFGEGGFGRESRNAWIRRQPELIAASGLGAIPEFYYTGRPEITWLDGWDESFLQSNDAYSILRCFTYGGQSAGGEPVPTYPVLVSHIFLEENSLHLGDETAIMLQMEIVHSRGTSTVEFPLPVKIIGVFRQTGQKANVYTPLSFWCDPGWITGEEDILPEGERPLASFQTEQEQDKFYYTQTSFRTCRFTLASAYGLEPFRAYLAEGGYSQVGQVGRNRLCVLLLDQAFQEAVGGLGRYISFGRILFPVLYAVVALMGFVISWLMVNGRRMEFAILRGLGASRGRVFFSFFLEQGALCLAGSLLGALALTAFYPSAALWLAAAGFSGCYLAGCVLSVLAVGRTKLMSLLSERE